MGYKVKAHTDAAYEDVIAELRKHDVSIALEAPHRKFVTVEQDLSRNLVARLAELGGHVVEDFQYDLENPG